MLFIVTYGFSHGIVEARATRLSNLVQEIMDLLELFRAQRARVHAFDLPAKVLQCCCVGGGGNGEGDDLDSHDVTVSASVGSSGAVQEAEEVV